MQRRNGESTRQHRSERKKKRSRREEWIPERRNVGKWWAEREIEGKLRTREGGFERSR